MPRFVVFVVLNAVVAVALVNALGLPDAWQTAVSAALMGLGLYVYLKTLQRRGADRDTRK